MENLVSSYKGKKVFITGASGFKGTWLNLYLKKLGAVTFNYSLPENDILDLPKLKKTLEQFEPNIVFHLAAQPLVRFAYKNPIETFQTNTIGTANVLEASRNINNLKSIVIITTDKVYLNKEQYWGYKETDALGGFDPYSASKACAELVINSYRDSYLSSNKVLVASARAGNIIGGGDTSADRIFVDIADAVFSNKELTIRSPEAIRPFQYVLDCLRGYLMLGARLLEGDEAFASSWNFGPADKNIISVVKLLNTVKDCGYKLKYRIVENPLHETGILKLDSSKTNALLNWHPIYNIIDTVSSSLHWYKSKYEANVDITEVQINTYIKDALLYA